MREVSDKTEHPVHAQKYLSCDGSSPKEASGPSCFFHYDVYVQNHSQHTRPSKQHLAGERGAEMKT